MKEFGYGAAFGIVMALIICYIIFTDTIDKYDLKYKQLEERFDSSELDRSHLRDSIVIINTNSKNLTRGLDSLTKELNKPNLRYKSRNDSELAKLLEERVR